MSRPVDVVALLFGVLLAATAAVSLWTALRGPVDPALLRVGVPVLLVAVGLGGLALSRNRT